MEHCSLGRDNFGQIALHEYHSVFAIRRKVWDEQMHHLDHFAFGLGEPGMIRAGVFDGFEFEVAARIVVVSGAAAIRERLHAARDEHLHHQAGARTRQARDNRDEVLQ